MPKSATTGIAFKDFIPTVTQGAHAKWIRLMCILLWHIAIEQLDQSVAFTVCLCTQGFRHL